MIPIRSLEDIRLLRESSELECKLASGRDGQGQLPTDFWPTYSAFANSHGGIIVLGLKELSSGFEVVGISNVRKVRADIFNQLNNRQKVSANLVDEQAVQEVVIEGKSIIVIEIPAAGRKDRPVHINGNPLTGTYRRVDEGDRLCDGETIKRMLAEQTEDSRDNRVLKNFDLSDLSGETIRAYRQAMRDRQPNHPFLDADDVGFLRQIGAMRKDRETASEGITIAGLLMFGLSASITDEFPNYFLDYQERSQAKAEARWIDRVTIDGTWTGNLYDFFRRVYRKLVSDLKVPFALHDGKRQDETPVHEALREALVNTLVHADYTGRVPILVVKRPDMFGFRNPGLMRIPVSQAIKGGESDGRNRTLQSMFLLVGAGERAGSGVPKIHKGWADQHWRPPSLYEREQPSEQTLLELKMIDLVPQEAMQLLRELFGRALETMSSEQRLVLAVAATESFITHAKLMPLCNMHPTDLTRLLQGLVQQGFLEQHGRSRGAAYRLPGGPLPDPDTVFGPTHRLPDSVENFLTMEEIGAKGAEPVEEGRELGGKDRELDDKGREQSSEPYEAADGRKVDGLPYPIIDSLDSISVPLRLELEALSAPVSKFGKVPSETSQAVVSAICEKRYLTIRVIAALLGRDEEYLRQRILNPMVDERALYRAFPQAPNDPRQAYTSSPTPS